MSVVVATAADGFAGLVPGGTVEAIAPARLRGERVDEHVAVVAGGDLRARASLWWTDAPPVAGESPGVIGHYAAADDAAAAELLAAARARLAAAGRTLAIGPMDGNTWRRYRLVTWRGDEPRFALEPENPEAWPAQWLADGFAVREEYISSVVERLDRTDPRADEVWPRLAAAGVTVRPLDAAALEAELARIYAVSEIAFRANVLYTPLPREEFLAMYRAAAPLLRPGLSLIAERAGEPVGFVFAIPDAERAARRVAVDTVIVKTLAILPDRALAGLGRVLLARSQLAAHAAGFRRAIHALMHVANRSTTLGVEARVVRRYALFGRRP